MIETVLSIVATLAGVAGLYVSTKGASQTKKSLLERHENDAVVNLLAWGDEKLLHFGDAAPTVQNKKH